MRYSIVLPTLNEAENIVNQINQIKTALAEKYASCEIIIVDDQSPDGTAEIIQNLAADDAHLKLIEVSERSRAKAIYSGLMHSQGDYIVVMDADGQHDPRALPSFFEQLENGFNIVVGSRWTHYDPAQQTLTRQLISRIGCKIGQWAGIPLSDPTSGFFALDRATLQSVLPKISPRGFRIFQEIWFAAETRHCIEIPFRFGKREHGRSKMPINHLFFLGFALIKMRYAQKFATHS